MLQWMKKYKNWIIGSTIVVMVLVIAFLSGGTKTAPPSSSGETATDSSGQELFSSVRSSTESDSSRRDTMEGRNESEGGSSTWSEGTDSDTSERNSGVSTDTGAGRSTEKKSESTSVDRNADTNSTNTENTESASAASDTEVETTENEPVTFSCTISISCANILNHLDSLDPAKTELVPEGGVILGTTTVTVTEGDSVYDVLRRICSNAGISLDASFTPATGSAYVRGIQNIYEFDCGSLSGWKYSVNGSYSNYGCSAYILKEGDSIKWNYVCDINE